MRGHGARAPSPAPSHATPGARQASTAQCNMVDMTRRSLSYEMRLAKYGVARRRGGRARPRPRASRPNIFERPWKLNNGLSRLLLLERLRTPEARFQYRTVRGAARERPHLAAPSSIPRAARRKRKSAAADACGDYQHILARYLRDPWLKERADETMSAANASDYSTVFLPWGPKWTAKRVRAGCARVSRESTGP